jgi:hypothetical protein
MVNYLAIWGIRSAVSGNIFFILITDREQHIFSEIQIAPLVSKVLKNIGFHNGINRASFFTKAAENTLG